MSVMRQQTKSLCAILLNAYSLALDSANQGKIRQTIATTPGHWYQVSFMVSVS